jgi:hypothetical protein
MIDDGLGEAMVSERVWCWLDFMCVRRYYSIIIISKTLDERTMEEERERMKLYIDLVLNERIHRSYVHGQT